MTYDILRDKTLAFFFSCGISMKVWHDIGMIDREVAIYNELSKYFRHIYFFTYGGEEDLGYRRYLADNITIIPKKYFKNNILYSFKLPFIHRKILRQADILKTNQMFGAWSAAIARLLYRKRLVVRTGYMWSIFYGMNNHPAWKRGLINLVERFAYRAAHAAVNSSRADYDYVEQHYHPKRHILIPNYVETNIFKPLETTRQPKSLCFVGSLQYVKNPLALLEAMKGLPYSIDFVGSGPQSDELEEMAQKSGIRANFLGNIPNHELPSILNGHEAFILPSLWEGMPKTLLEAMACALPVIGTNVPGIKEVISDGGNGILCDTDAGSIRQAIIRLMEDEQLRKRLGENARKTIEDNYSLQKIVGKELELYLELFTQSVPPRLA